MESSDTLKDVPSYRYDLVDVARQSLSAVFGNVALNEFASAIESKNKLAAQQSGKKLVGLIDDFDTLLNTNENFMLGPWIKWARQWGDGKAKAIGDWYEFNARNLLTLWGPNGNINDYARKAWGGLVKDYYLHRWSTFVDMQIESVADGKAFNVERYEAQMLLYGQEWCNSTQPIFPTEAIGDTVE